MQVGTNLLNYSVTVSKQMPFSSIGSDLENKSLLRGVSNGVTVDFFAAIRRE